MGINMPDGRWWDIPGLFYSDGSHNDQWIWNYIVKENVSIINDVFELTDERIVDRGFIRCTEAFPLHYPSSLAEGKNQLSTVDANRSRLVTRLRNTNERRLKQWSILFGRIDSGYFLILGDLVRALAAIENAYFPPLLRDMEYDDSDLAVVAARRVKAPIQTCRPQVIPVLYWHSILQTWCQT